MAKIDFGLGTSHGPMLSIDSKHWGDRVPFDRKAQLHYQSRVYGFDELAELRKGENLPAQVAPDEAMKRHARCQIAIAEMSQMFAARQPDVAVVIGNDQMEVFTNEHVPAFAVFWGEYVEGHPRAPEYLAKLDPAIARAELDRTPAEYTQYPCSPALGRHVIESVVAEGFDVAQIKRLSAGEIGVNSAPHAYGFVYRRLMLDKVPAHVPVFVNTFYPPNQPTAGRCFAFGQALARAIQSWAGDSKVAVIASGGMSHFVIDEAFDREVLDAIAKGDAAAMSRIPESIFQSGTSEIKNWIVAAGAMAEAGLTMKLIDYVPCYRSEAGTGSAMGFASWS